MFSPNAKFKKVYDQIFKENPISANMYLLLCELADEKGEVAISDEDLHRLMIIRFDHPKEYALKRGDL